MSDGGLRDRKGKKRGEKERGQKGTDWDYVRDSKFPICISLKYDGKQREKHDQSASCVKKCAEEKEKQEEGKFSSCLQRVSVRWFNDTLQFTQCRMLDSKNTLSSQLHLHL